MATAAVFYFRGDLGGLPFGLLVAAAAFWFVIPGHGLIYGPHFWLLALAEFASSPFRRRDDGPPSDE